MFKYCVNCGIKIDCKAGHEFFICNNCGSLLCDFCSYRCKYCNKQFCYDCRLIHMGIQHIEKLENCPICKTRLVAGIFISKSGLKRKAIFCENCHKIISHLIRDATHRSGIFINKIETKMLEHVEHLFRTRKI
jgi:predicted DNA-binding helix-hairpin-helix protein